MREESKDGRRAGLIISIQLLYEVYENAMNSKRNVRESRTLKLLEF